MQMGKQFFYCSSSYLVSLNELLVFAGRLIDDVITQGYTGMPLPVAQNNKENIRRRGIL